MSTSKSKFWEEKLKEAEIHLQYLDKALLEQQKAVRFLKKQCKEFANA